jgi:hypothetical protein
MAPEVIKGTQMTSGWMKADVWSLGCTVVEMLTGNLPYAEFENPMTAMYHIASGKTPPLDKNSVSAAATDFVETCCNVDPDKRPSVKELLCHDFVKDIDPNMTIDLKDDIPEVEGAKESLSNGRAVMSSTEMRVILSCDERDRKDLHQSPDNSPPPSPPKDLPDDINDDIRDEDTNFDDELTAYNGPANGLTRNVGKTSLLDSVESLSSSNVSISAVEKTNAPLALLQKTAEDDETEALNVLELQNTPSIYATTRKNKSTRKMKMNQFPREENVEKKKTIIADVKKKTFPAPPTESSASSSTYIRRNKSNDLITKPIDTIAAAVSETTCQSTTVPDTGVVELENDENKVVKPSPSTSVDQTDVDNMAERDKEKQTEKERETKREREKEADGIQDIMKHCTSSDSRAETSDELSPLNNSSDKSILPVDFLQYKRERQVSTDSSGMEEDTSHKHPPSNSLKKNKKMGLSKSFSVKSEKIVQENENKPLSLAKHLSKKLSNLSVNTNHCIDSDGGGVSSSGYCPSRGSSSGDYEYIEDENEDEMSHGKEEKKINAIRIRNDTNTAPSYHDKASAGLGDNEIVNSKRNSQSKKNKSSEVSTSTSTSTSTKEVKEDLRPIAPFTSEKLFLHNNLGADNFSRAGQGGAAAVRKEAALAMNSNHSHNHSHKHTHAHAHNHHGHSHGHGYGHTHLHAHAHPISKYGGYHAASKSSLKHHTSYKKSSKRSKSANVGVTGSSKLVLPSLLAPTHAQHGAAGQVVVIPQLALRVIQSAPTVTRSLNLPPLMKSKTPSNKKSKSKSGVFTAQSDQAGVGLLSAGGEGGGSFQKSLRFVSDEAEQEGGILAPRKSDA